MSQVSQQQQSILDDTMRSLEEQEQLRLQVPEQKTRKFFQGLSFNTSDEVEASIRSLGSDDSYEDILKNIRQGLKAYEEAKPLEAMSYELGGAVAPAVGGALFTGGGSLGTLATRAPTMYKLLGLATPNSVKQAIGWGTAQGTLSGFGSGEGVEDRLTSSGVGGVTGGVLGGTVQKVAPYISGAAIDVVDYVRRKVGDRGSKVVENELQRLASESGMTVDEIVEGVANGTIMAENRTLHDAVRSYRASGGDAATELQKTMTTRPTQKRSEAMGSVEDSLSDVVDPNIERAMIASKQEAMTLERKAYEPFSTQIASPEIVTEIKDAVLRVPAVKGALNKIHRSRTGSTEPLIKVVDGVVEITDDLTVEQAEVARRTIDALVKREYKTGIGTVAEEWSVIGGTLRNALDIDVPDLASTRELARMTRASRDAYENGQKAFSKNPDLIEIELDKAAEQGEEVLKAYRLGAFQQIKSKMSTGQYKNFMASLTDPQKRESKALELLLPEENYDAVIKTLNTANLSQQASTKILGGSDTAITKGQQARQGSRTGFSDVVEALGGNPVAAIRMVGNLVKKTSPELTDAERLKIVEVLVSENPNIVRNALIDDSGMAMLQDTIEKILYATKAGIQRGATVGVSPIAGDKASGLLNPQ